MSTLVPLSYQTHKDLYWESPDKFSFADKDTCCPISFSELPAALMSLPLAFIRHGDSFVLIVLQGFRPNENLLVDTNGNWLCKFRPIAYSYFPFLVAHHEGVQIVCERSDSGFVTSNSSHQRLFDESGDQSSTLHKLVEDITRHRASVDLADRITSLLSEFELLKQWKITIKGENGPVAIDGIYCIDEEKLNRLSGEQLEQLRDSGGLMVCYSQLLSMINIEFLRRMLDRKSDKESLLGDNISFDSGGSISFDNI